VAFNARVLKDSRAGRRWCAALLPQGAFFGKAFDPVGGALYRKGRTNLPCVVRCISSFASHSVANRTPRRPPSRERQTPHGDQSRTLRVPRSGCRCKRCSSLLWSAFSWRCSGPCTCTRDTRCAPAGLRSWLLFRPTSLFLDRDVLVFPCTWKASTRVSVCTGSACIPRKPISVLKERASVVRWRP